jgi:hypothetical protein
MREANREQAAAQEAAHRPAHFEGARLSARNVDSRKAAE